ncbi:hypothetical protein FRC03_005383 [Tulasnella sp. 419]|nr:hypothetical protein FRC03_005383 [Tulasnella sp. 419]
MPAAVQRQFPQRTRNSPRIHDAQYILEWFFLFRCHPFNTFHYSTGYVFTVQGDLMPTIHILRHLPANILPISNQSTSTTSPISLIPRREEQHHRTQNWLVSYTQLQLLAAVPI